MRSGNIKHFERSLNDRSVFELQRFNAARFFPTFSRYFAFVLFSPAPLRRTTCIFVRLHLRRSAPLRTLQSSNSIFALCERDLIMLSPDGFCSTWFRVAHVPRSDGQFWLGANRNANATLWESLRLCNQNLIKRKLLDCVTFNQVLYDHLRLIHLCRVYVTMHISI